MPASRRHEWAALLGIDEELKRRTRIEEYLDRGFGHCELRNLKVASLVEENWLRFDGMDYRLLAWVIMPNHVHLLVEIWQKPMTELLQNWKGYTARRVNRVLGRRGKLWQDDYWDRYIRNETHYRKVVHYIEWNPVKAGLVRTPEQWPCRQRASSRRIPSARTSAQASHAIMERGQLCPRGNTTITRGLGRSALRGTGAQTISA